MKSILEIPEQIVIRNWKRGCDCDIYFSKQSAKTIIKLIVMNIRANQKSIFEIHSFAVNLLWIYFS